MNFETARLRLETISPLLAERILAGRRTTQDLWHPEYPLVDELDPLRSLAANSMPDPVFTMYMIRQACDGLAIGGFGFFGPPDDSGCVEIGYGLVAAARGIGLATEAVRAALRVAAEHGATVVTADTENGHRASQRVLLKAGFVEVRRDQQATFFARPIGSPFSPAQPVVYELDGSVINDLDDLYRLLGESSQRPGRLFRRQPWTHSTIAWPADSVYPRTATSCSYSTAAATPLGSRRPSGNSSGASGSAGTPCT